ncbi:unnamed protein product [Kluyveromyces dobzhanskii CBS 2104]|uniref:Pre-mRNA-processing factor 19 n=1 Tax=Kluyveromyces dobzhanskii CBS 2104 TaxID=1427455 RepID=A0A0A8L3Z1_9SACH|nr:unnamed protein product [Kluyveromyces dobzhanskii CBS 2104]
MFCAISGKPPLNAVLSPNSKCIFEQNLIEQYIDQNGTDPVTNDPLQKADLIEISLTPQQFALSQSLNSSTIANNYSIPSLLTTLQKEWDAVMLENFELRKQLDLSKKSLSDALYRSDALASAAAKAFVERDQLRQELAALSSSITTVNTEPAASANGEIQSELLLPEFIEELSAKSQQYVLSSKKIKKKLQHFTSNSLLKSTEFPKSDLISTNEHFDLSERSVVVKDNDKAYVFGAADITVNVSQNADYLLEYDGIMYCLSQGKLIASDLKTKNTLYEKTVEGIEGQVIFMGYPKQITDFYFIIVTEEGTIYGYKLLEETLFTISQVSLDGPVQFVSYHKDGALLAVGNRSGGVYILNLLSPMNDPILFSTPFLAKTVFFGMNGYWLFVFGDNDLNVFDLRKDAGTLAMEPNHFDRGVVSVELDDTAKGFFISSGDSQIHWYEFIKGKSFVEKSTLPIESSVINAIILVQSHDGYQLKVVSDSKCLTYALN